MRPALSQLIAEAKRHIDHHADGICGAPGDTLGHASNLLDEALERLEIQPYHDDHVPGIVRPLPEAAFPASPMTPRARINPDAA